MYVIVKQDIMKLLLFVICSLVLNLSNAQNFNELYQKSVDELKSGKPNDAISTLDKILKSDAKNKDALFFRSYIYYTMEEFEKALSDLNQLVILDSTNVEFIKNRSRTKYALGD